MSSLFKGITLAHQMSPHMGVVALKKEQQLITPYLNGRIAVGVESFSTPTDQLIVNGLVAKYPGAFVIGSGNEGLKELLTKIDKAVLGFKSSVEKGDKPKSGDVTEATNAALKEVNNTFNKTGFFGKGGFKKSTDIQVGILQNYTGKGDKKFVLSTLATMIPGVITEMKSYLADTKSYWSKAEAVIKELKKLNEDQKDEASKILQLAGKTLGDPFEAITVNIYRPWSDENSLKPNSTLPSLNVNELEQATELLVLLLDTIKETEDLGRQIAAVGDYSDPYKTLEWLTKGGNYPGKSILWDCLSWDGGYAMPGMTGWSLQSENLTRIGTLLEKWINESNQ